MRKSRHVLPFSRENETACMAAYACSPFAERLAKKSMSSSSGTSVSVQPHQQEQQLPGGRRAKALNGVTSPCDAAIISLATPLFNRSRRRFFFGIGINYISQPKSQLTSCWNDVDTLQNLFSRRYGNFDQTWIVTDRPTPKRIAPFMMDAQPPTSVGIRKTWSRILREVSKCKNSGQDVDLILVYSGHGTFRLTTDLGEIGGQSDALILLDQLMYDYEVMSQIVRPLGNHVHLLIVFDSCNSGSAANLPWTYNPLSHTVNQTSLHTDLTNDVVMISGCRDEQTSAAGATTNDVSECTRVLVETLKEHPRAGSLGITDLLKTMRNKLVAAQDTQIPVLSLSKPQLLQALL